MLACSRRLDIGERSERKASEKNAGKLDGQRVFSLAFPSSRLSPLSERLGQVTGMWLGPRVSAYGRFDCIKQR